MKRLLVLLTALMLSACAATGPFDAAETPLQKSYALQQTYNVILVEAEKIVTDETAPIELRRAVQAAEARTTPVIDALAEAATLYVVESAKFESGQTTEEKLDVVTANLLVWLEQGEAALLEILAAVEG